MEVIWWVSWLLILVFWVQTGRAWLCWFEAYGLVVFIDRANPVIKFLMLLFWPAALLVWMYCEWMDL